MTLNTIPILGSDGSTQRSMVLDVIAGVSWPPYKMAYGAEGAATLVSASNRLPVAVTSLPLPLGASVADLQLTDDYDTGAGEDVRRTTGLVSAEDGGGVLVGSANPMPTHIRDSGGIELGTSASPFFVALSDGTSIFDIDVLSGHIVMIDALHHHIHNEMAFSVCNIFDAVAAGASADLRVTVPAGKELHLTFSVAAILKSRISLYEGTTFSADGTVVPSFNKRRSSGLSTSVVIRHTPTVDVLGLQFEGPMLIPAGTKVNQSAGGAGTGRDEWDLKEGEYLVRVTNNGAQESDTGICLAWYEVDV